MLATWSLVPLPAWTSGCSRFMYCWSLAWRILSLVVQRLKRLPEMWETWVQSLDWEDSLEKAMAIHSSILAWRIPWREEPGRLQFMGSQRVGHDWATSLHFTSSLWFHVADFCFKNYGVENLFLTNHFSFLFFLLLNDKLEQCIICYLLWKCRGCRLTSMHAPSLVRFSICSTYRPLFALTALLFLYDLALVKQKDVRRAHKMQKNMLMKRGD